MDIASREQLLPQNSEQIAIKRNIWNQLGLDTQLDVFQCLRAYDLYKNGRFASRQWYDVIERHKEMLPKIRKIPYWRAQNRLSGDSNEEIWRQRVEHRKIRENRVKNYALLCIISSIAAIAAQPISIERTSAIFLLLAVSLRMGNAYTKFWNDPYRLTFDNDGYSIYDGQYYIKICYKRYSADKLDILRHVWLGYLGTRSIIFVIIGTLRHIVQVDNIFDAFLWILHFPEAGYLMNWCFNVCAVCIDCFFMGFCHRYQWKIQWLKPGHARDPRNDHLMIRFMLTTFLKIFKLCQLLPKILMDIAYREQLVPQNSEQIAIKPTIWNQLGLDTQLDVFHCLRAYDLYRNGRFVSCQWYNVIEQHRGMLPKFRKLRDCSEQNKIIESDEERLQCRYKIWKAEKRTNRIRRNLSCTYLPLSIVTFIAVLLAQPISAEQIAAKVLLLTATLLMGETYGKVVYDDDQFLICGQKCLIRLKLLKYVWAAYIVALSLIFVGFAILAHFIHLPADTLFNTILATLYLPEGVYLINWSINACNFPLWFNYQYKKTVVELRPELRDVFVYQNKQWILPNGHLPTRVNIYAWSLVILKFRVSYWLPAVSVWPTLCAHIKFLPGSGYFPYL